MNLLPRYHIVGYSGTTLHLTVRYRAHIPPTGYTLHRALTIHEVAAPSYDVTNNKPTGTGRTSLRQATPYIGRSQSMRWLLLDNTWGLTLQSGLVA